MCIADHLSPAAMIDRNLPQCWQHGQPMPRRFRAFADETQSAGINSVYAGDWEYMVGGGAADLRLQRRWLSRPDAGRRRKAGELLSQRQHARRRSEVHQPRPAVSNSPM